MIAIGMSPAGGGGAGPAPNPNEWVRDPNWMRMPDVDENDEAFYGLILVFENEYNLVTWDANVGTTIDVGDGTSPIAGTGGDDEHLYDYASIAATVYQYQPDPSIPARNYKQVMFTVTGTISRLRFIDSASGINSGGNNNFVDINCSVPNSTNQFILSSFTLRKMSICERLRIWAWGGTIALRPFDGMTSLRVLELPETGGGSLQYLLSSFSVLDMGDLTTDVTDIRNLSRSVNGFVGVRSVKNIVANSVTGSNSERMHQTNNNLQFVESLTCTGTSLDTYCFSCRSLYYHGEINMPNLTIIDRAFDGCIKLREVSFTDCSSVTNTFLTFRDCYSLYFLVMNGLTVGVDLSDTNLGNYGMNLFANSIGTANGSQTITVTGTPFGSLVSASDATALTIQSVMTGKGYTIAN